MVKRRQVTWKKFEKFLLFVGCKFKRQKGDHRIYIRSDLNRPIVVPRYSPLPIFIVRNNLRVLGLSLDEFYRILDTM